MQMIYIILYMEFTNDDLKAKIKERGNAPLLILYLVLYPANPMR